MTGQLGRLLLQLGSTLILARVLAPQDYGTVAMVTAIVSVGELLQDFGLSSAAVQAETMSHAQHSNLFWINTSIGLALSLLVFGSAGAIADFYHNAAVLPIAKALAFSFLINGLASQFRAHLNRNFQMSRLALVNVLAQLAALVAGLLAALAGWGAWALVTQQLTLAGTNLVLIVHAARWLPGLPVRDVPMRSFLRFGGNLMATQLVGLISRNLNTVLIGNRFGAELAGIYDRAFLLLMLPLNQINAPATTVALPVLSKLHDDPLRFERFILHGQTVLLHVLLAIFAFSAAAGEPLIVLVLGEQWSAAAPLFRILTIAGAFQTASYASYWAFLAKGLPHVVLRYSLVTRAGLVGLILLGLSWGMVGVTLAYSVGIACMWPLGLWWLGRNSDAPVRAMASNGVRALSAYLACTGATFAAVHAARAAAPALQLVAAALAMLASVGFLYCTWPQYRRDLQAIANTRKLLGSGAGASQPDAPDAWGSA